MDIVKYALALVLCLLLIVPTALGIGNYPKTFVDDANRSITINKPIEKIIPLVTWSYEPLYILGAKDMIVGITSNAKTVYPWLEGINNKPVVGSYMEHDYEKIIQLKPDVILTQARYVGSLDKNLSGIQVVALDFSNQSGFERDMSLLAELVGNEDRATEFLEWRNEELNDLHKALESLKPDEMKRVFITYTDKGSWSWKTAGRGTAKDTLIVRAGGINIAGGYVIESPTIDPEWIMKENPQAIVFVHHMPIPQILTDYDVNSTENITAYIDEQKMRDGIKDSDACKEGRLYVIDMICSDAIRNFIGAQYLAKWLYPDLCKDIDPDAVHKEYFERWLGVPYKGVWVYPNAS